jgi:hypothetical protein
VALFSRRSSPDRLVAEQREAIARFWAWWQAEGAGQIAASIDERKPERSAAPLSRHVTAIHPDLAWELGPGRDSEHELVVSAQGDPALRAIARRWRQAAPVADARWSYSDYRAAAPEPADVVLTLQDARFDVASATAWARVVGTHFDVQVHHPGFAALGEAQRTLAAFLLLETVLGEAALETWVGSASATAQAPLDPVPLTGLRSVVRELESRFTDGQGEPAWIVMEGLSQDGDPVLASAQVPLRASRAPHLDTYVEITVPFSDSTAAGLPAHGSLTALRDFEDHLNSRLGGSGHIVAHQTHQGVRIMHAYVDATTPAVEQLRAAIVGWDQGAVSLTSAADPGWVNVQHLRG